MKVKDVTNYLESIAPLSLQESYDNAGLLVGDENEKVIGVLVTLDVTEDVLDEAIAEKCNMVIAHHPIIFSGIKRLTKSNYVSRILMKAIKNNLLIYAIHTNLDNVPNGVNGKIADVLGLSNRKILSPKSNLFKLVVFTPESHSNKVLDALFNSGAGHIGNYSHCSFVSAGKGSFKPLEGSNPFAGKIGDVELQNEDKLEVLVPAHALRNVVKEMVLAHPYEEVAYDVIPLDNISNEGAGMIGVLPKPMEEMAFLDWIKNVFNSKMVRYTNLLDKPIAKVAICGGAGSFLLSEALKQKADVFITADFKYHQFFDADNRILIADLGHYESEQYTIQLLGDLLIKKFTTFAIRLTSVNTNPINYL